MLRAAETIERTDTGRQRRGNEDSMYARPPLFVVADGMGGAQAGEVASRIAVDAFKQGLPDSGAPEERLAARVREANAEIYDRAHSEQELAGMGTTLTAAYVVDTHVAIAHVGDSRAYLYRDGSLTRLTRDHSLVEELVLEGKLTEAQAAEHPQRSIITRALGPEHTVQVDTWTYPARGGDVLLLCSDGLTSMVSEERIGEILGSTDGLSQAADQLIDEANEAGGRDNITVILFRLEEVGADGQVVDQPTLVSGRPPGEATSASGTPRVDGPTTAETATGAAPVPPPTAESTRETTAERPASRVPLARTQGRPQPRQEGRRRRWAKPLAALLAVLIVLGLLGAGGYLATRQLYFIGTNSQGVVTIYRGLPYDLPAGVKLYETYYVSGVPASLVPSDRRSSLLNHNLRSQSDVQNLVRTLELGQLSR